MCRIARRAIEENVLKTCDGIVHNCVVVGHQRVCPILVVEPEGSVDVSTPDAELQVKRAIIKRTAPFNEKLFAHERITTPGCILFVPTGSLPRTTVSPLEGFTASLLKVPRRRRRETLGELPENKPRAWY